MSASLKTLAIPSSPHIGGTLSTDRIMFHVVLALLPVSVFAVYLFGLAALLVLVIAVASWRDEDLLCRLSGQATTVGDWSVVITGLLYGLVLPPSLPLWMVAAGGVIGVGLGKFLFGGLGSNLFNPALVGLRDIAGCVSSSDDDLAGLVVWSSLRSPPPRLHCP